MHGRHGEDPFAGPSSQDYRYPPVRHEPRIQQLSDDLEQLGLQPFHLPMGVRLIQDARCRATADSPCIRCDRVDGFPCVTGAKADAERAVIRPALAAQPNLTLMTGTRVERLLTDGAGRSVTGATVTLPDGSPGAVTADVVVLSAGAILSAALLLKSATARHPRGLANSSDLVGRNYMRHNNLALIAFSPEPNPTVFAKTLALNDFYGPGEHWPYPMGNIQLLGQPDDWQIKSAAPRGLGWTPPAPYGTVARHSIGFWLSSEDLPRADSRVTLRPDGAIKLAVQPGNNTEGLGRLRRTLQGLLGKLGMADTMSVPSLYLHKTPRPRPTRPAPPGSGPTRPPRPLAHLVRDPATARAAAAIDRIALVVSGLDRTEGDYVGTFGCRVEQRGPIEPALTRVLGLRPDRGRRSLLRLGRERIELLEFTDSAGHLYPPDSTSTDLWFQHLAIVAMGLQTIQVTIDRAFQRGGRHRFRRQARPTHRVPLARPPVNR